MEVNVIKSCHDVFYVIQEVKPNDDCVFMGACIDLLKAFETIKNLKSVDNITADTHKDKIIKCMCSYNKTEYEVIYLDK